eukprot:TRINITY_DN6469_c0_g1_i1.p2 TRINITY_DN6469_c0_g1~~TRINITY_DN6469_c0_g1_i1.p2  ORF type:complete len:77 (+),score=1.70 TRINITY_DN6469_c0_g1_i1:294-524(+)
MNHRKRSEKFQTSKDISIDGELDFYSNYREEAHPDLYISNFSVYDYYFDGKVVMVTKFLGIGSRLGRESKSGKWLM